MFSFKTALYLTEQKPNRSKEMVVKKDIFGTDAIKQISKKTYQYYPSTPEFFSNLFALKAIEFLNTTSEEQQLFLDKEQDTGLFYKMLSMLKSDLIQFVPPNRLKLILRKLYTIKENTMNEQTMSGGIAGGGNGFAPTTDPMHNPDMPIKRKKKVKRFKDAIKKLSEEE